MNAVLADIIRRFRAAQDRGVATLIRDLGIPLPTSNVQWVFYCAEHGLFKIRSINGVGFYAHGYGVELVLDDVTIDFDWGAAGEPDGFDTWRLWNFVCVNKLDVACDSYAQVKAWLEQAHQCGEVTQNDLYGLYYSPGHRVPRTGSI